MTTLRGALVGYGFIGAGGHCPAYLDQARAPRREGAFTLEAIADVCPERRALAKARVPGARVYDDYRRMLDAEAGRLDFVDIATPPCDHAAIAHAALDAGLHVLVEKPITTTADDAARLLAHAEEARRVVFPCHNYKHAPVVKSVRRALDQGKIGDLRFITLHTFRPTHARGVAEWRPDWRRDRAISGGGIGMDHGSHTFYLAFDWLNAFPESVTAFTSTTTPHSTEDTVSCTLRFPEGRLASAHLSWTSGMRRVIYTLHGSRGALRVEDDDVETVLQVRDDDRAPLRWESTHENAASDWMDASHVGWYRSVLDAFADAIARSDYAGLDARDALQCVATIEGCYRSAADGSRELALPHSRARRASMEGLTTRRRAS